MGVRDFSADNGEGGKSSLHFPLPELRLGGGKMCGVAATPPAPPECSPLGPTQAIPFTLKATPDEDLKKSRGGGRHPTDPPLVWGYFQISEEGWGAPEIAMEQKME